MIAQSAWGVDHRSKNKAIVERYFHEVLDRKQFQLIRELYADDSVIEFPGRPIIKGPAAMERAVRDALSQASTFRTDILNLVAEGDLVVARIEHDARYEEGFMWRNRDGITPTRLPMTRAHWAAMTLFRIERGKIVEQWISRDELGVLLQNGAISVEPLR
jgi:predicted SnoaL-like aldol condensation-catalyzing enzyme